MEPALSLDTSVLAANARAWREHLGVPLYAVVKADGYGWGAARLVRALDGIADGFCVADADELRQVRRHTQAPVILLGAATPDRLAEAYRANAQPSIGSMTELEVAQRVFEGLGKPLRVRVGIRPAAAWTGLSVEEVRTFAPALKQSGALVQVWTHITDFENRRVQLETFRAGLQAMQAAGVRVEGTDVASTFPAAADGPLGDLARIGVGLFGATGGFALPHLQCALNVVAPVVRVERHSAGTRLGYGGTMLADGETIATARCGYADGLPKSLAGADDILSVGMQYITARASRLDASGGQLALLDRESDLDAFAARCARLPHEIVTGFGNRARSSGVSVEV